MTFAQTWDLRSYFPSFDGPEYREHLASLQQDMERMEERARALADMRADNLEQWAGVLLLDERILAAYSHLASYVACLSSAHAGDERYSAAQARVSALGARLTAAFVPVLDALRRVEPEVFDALLARQELAGAGYALDRLRQEAQKTMAPELETLAAELGVDGISAWGRLYDDVSGRLEFEMPGEEGPRPVPMARKRSLLEDPDPAVRKAALENSNRAWERMAPVAAAGLNALAGTRLTLYRRRGREDFLEEPLFRAAMERRTVEAMWRAVASRREVAWRWLRRKAELLGRERLGFQDLAAPLPQAGTARMDWDRAAALVLDAFEAGYPALGRFARTMLENGFVEAEQRAGKRPGAFCTTSLLTRESRVFMSFGGGPADVQTLAHELGHAFHGYTLRSMRPFAARYPMTLAETASIHAEGLLRDALLAREDVAPGARLQVLAGSLDHAATFVCDIHMRFLFERAFYEERGRGEVGVSRLKELMLQAQQECYGDTLDPDEQDPMFWASKLHFHIAGVSFYNFPYTFGYLFSLSLAAQARQMPAARFHERYENLLRLTGSMTAEEVARESFGLDIGEEAFWLQALDLVDEERARLEELLAAMPKD